MLPDALLSRDKADLAYNGTGKEMMTAHNFSLALEKKYIFILASKRTIILRPSVISETIVELNPALKL